MKTLNIELIDKNGANCYSPAVKTNHVRIQACTYMKKDIHPNYTQQASITCACGESYEIGSTIEKMQTELCAACHPFYTGKQKIMDTARRVEKFETRASLKTDDKTGKKAKAEKRTKQKITKREDKERADA